MMRIYAPTVRAAAAFVLALAFASSSAAQSAAPVVLDGVFDEWDAVPAAVTDAADAPAPFADIREVRVRDDAQGVYLLLVLERPLSLQAMPGTVQLVLDTDGDAASGWEEAGLRGVDAVVEFSPRTPNGALAGVSLRAPRRPGEAPEERPATDAGVMMAPTLASRRFEVRLRRGAPFRFGGRLSARLVSRDRAGAVVDRTPVFSAPLPIGQPRPTPPGHDAADPLARAPGTDFRLLSWNVGRDDFFEATLEFGALLRAVQPDLIMLDEVDGDENGEHVLAILNRVAPGDRPWQAVFGASGGTQRGVVAARAPVSVAAPFAGRVAYPDSALSLVPRDAPAAAHQAAARRAREGVPTVGAVAELGGRRVLAVTVDLECCGDADGPADRLRRLEAAVLRDRIRETLRGGGVDAVIVAGDYNLVGTAAPLEILAADSDTDGSGLLVAQPRRLDGLSMATWEQRGDRFTPGRLDYVLIGDAALAILRSFPFHSGDLSRPWRVHHGLDAETSQRATDHLPIVTDLRWTGG